MSQSLFTYYNMASSIRQNTPIKEEDWDTDAGSIHHVEESSTKEPENERNDSVNNKS